VDGAKVVAQKLGIRGNKIYGISGEDTIFSPYFMCEITIVKAFGRRTVLVDAIGGKSYSTDIVFLCKFFQTIVDLELS
jgi:hypothetical protein